MRSIRDPISIIPDEPVASTDRPIAARVSPSYTPVSEQASPSRALRVAQDAAAWLDMLLRLACGLPVSDGDEAVGRAFVEGLSEVLPGYSVAVCLVSYGEGRVFAAPAPAGESRAHRIDPTRVFSAAAYERVVPLDAEDSSTLHVAGEDPTLDDDTSTIASIVERAADVLRTGLKNVRAHEAASHARRELRTIQLNMAQADKLASFGQLAAGIVHELNNPLTSIVAYTDYLLRKSSARDVAPDEDDVERLRRIRESANRLLYFTRDLVTYARPSSDAPVAVSLHSAIEQALAFCEHVVAEVGARVERSFTPEVFSVRGVPQQIAQVFVNLVTNACHAMPLHGGRLRVETHAVDGEPGGPRLACITVEDNGHGIAAEHLQHVFTPFFTTKGEGRGTGLGLSIVKNIVEKCGGEIRAESEPCGGTRFIVLLPILP